MLIKYVREGSRLVGCVVAIGPGQIGWSVCSSTDRFNKELAVKIASGRAEKGSLASFPQYRKLNRFMLSDVLDNEITYMTKRSFKFFK